MACGAIRSWTVPSLVAAFLDLAFAFLILTAAALAFIASKFLALFGLALPCSCREPSGCLPSLLAGYTSRKVSGVHLALRESFRYDSACRCRCCDAKLSGVRKDDFEDVDRGVPETGGGEVEESCGSVSKPCASNFSLPATAQSDGAESRDSLGRGQMAVVKGKEILRAETSPMVLHRRRRRRDFLIIRGKSPHALLTPTPTSPLGWEKGAAAGTPFSGEMQRRASEAIPLGFTADGDRLSGNQISLAGGVASDKSLERSASCGTEQVCGSKEYETTIMRDLKQALEEERSARAALYLELEKERNAAATAAEEALAMILRLQEEKAAIEMEARQFQRMIEEKSAYDEEEMEILKEIILRREMEKHVLEKEVETYRTMMLAGGNVQRPSQNYLLVVASPLGEDVSSAFDSTDNPELVLKENYEIIEKEKLKDKMQGDDVCGHVEAKEQISLACFHSKPLSHCTAEDDFKKGHNIEDVHQNMLYHGDECNVQDKSMVTIEILPSSLQKEISGHGQVSMTDNSDKQKESGIHELTSCPNDEEGGAQTNIFMSHIQNTIETCTGSSQLETDPRIIDLHVIDDKIDMGEHENDELVVGCNSGLFNKYNKKKEPSRTNSCDLLTPDSAARCRPIEPSIHRSNSDMTKARHSVDGSYWRPLLLGSRRSSMSAVENERFKLESEVELLRNRLKLVQKGREKLSLSVEQREKESHHLQLLEEMALQLQELRKTAEPGTNLRQSSLPPSSFKVNLTKRRHSVSGALHEST